MHLIIYVAKTKKKKKERKGEKNEEKENWNVRLSQIVYTNASADYKGPLGRKKKLTLFKLIIRSPWMMDDVWWCMMIENNVREI